MDRVAFSSVVLLRPSGNILRTSPFVTNIATSLQSRPMASYSRPGRPNFQKFSDRDDYSSRSRPSTNGNNYNNNERRSRPFSDRQDNVERRFRDDDQAGRERRNSSSYSNSRPPKFNRDRRGGNSSDNYSSRQKSKPSYSDRSSGKPASGRKERDFGDDDDFQFRAEGDDDSTDGFGQFGNIQREDSRKQSGGREWGRDFRDGGRGGNGGRSNYRSENNRRNPQQQYNNRNYEGRQMNRYSNNRDGDEFKRVYEEKTLTKDQLVVRKAMEESEEKDLLYGVSPVHLALKTQRRGEMFRLFVQERANVTELMGDNAGPSKKRTNADAFEEILRIAVALEIPVMYASKHELNLLSENRPHQGVVLQTSAREFTDLKRLPLPINSTTGTDTDNDTDTTTTDTSTESKACYLVLDEVTDPQNVGALLRSAYFLRASGVIMCRRNSASLSPVVSKASAGALELMDVYGISSMPKFLNNCREDGWRVVGMSCGEDSSPLAEATLDEHTLIVMGSEGRGLRTLVRQACDELVEIEGGGDSDEVDSLNVSVAGAVALYQLLGSKKNSVAA